MMELLQQGLCNKYFPNSPVHTAVFALLVFISGYLLGSLNFGIIISKVFYNDDVRKHGSQGAGATNVQRTYGNFPAAATFLCDGLKAAAAVFIGTLLLGYNSPVAGPYIGGMASIIGHAFPIYYGFKGGKSIAAGFFMILCTSPIAGFICLILFLVIVAGTKFVSLGSVVATLIYPLILFKVSGIGIHILIAAFSALFVVYRHKANIKRLIAGNENKLNLKGK